MILKRDEISALGLHASDEIDVEIDEGRMIIARRSDPIEYLRACFAKTDPDVLDAVIDAATHQARRETMAMIKSERKRRG